jgi:transketolase
MRRAFADSLFKMAEMNDRVVFLTGDLGFEVFDDFRRRFGPRYVNVGVAEAHLMDAAAGLALEGFRPVAYSIASFATGRPFEQIRVSIAYHALPVVVVGAGGGYTYASSGVTHHAADDLGLMSLLPGMTVVAPGSPKELADLMPQLFQIPGPSYLRIGKFGEPDYPAAEPAVIARARLIRDGSRVAVLTVGDIVSEAVAAAAELQSEGISPVLYQIHTVKPLDTATLERLAGRTRTWVVVEEHLPTGGLFDAVSRWATDTLHPLRLVRLGAPDGFVFGNPHREALRCRIGIDRASIAAACRKAWAAGGVE